MFALPSARFVLLFLFLFTVTIFYTILQDTPFFWSCRNHGSEFGLKLMLDLVLEWGLFLSIATCEQKEKLRKVDISDTETGHDLLARGEQ